MNESHFLFVLLFFLHAWQLLSMLGIHHWTPRQPGQKGLRILSLDGGGTRGVLTIALLREVLKGFDKDVHEVTKILPCQRRRKNKTKHWHCYVVMFRFVVEAYRRITYFFTFGGCVPTYVCFFLLSRCLPFVPRSLRSISGCYSGVLKCSGLTSVCLQAGCYKEGILKSTYIPYLSPTVSLVHSISAPPPPGFPLDGLLLFLERCST